MNRYTSINKCRRSNFQIDFAGDKDKCISMFALSCYDYCADWAHLFDESNGQMVATFSKSGGLSVIV